MSTEHNFDMSASLEMMSRTGYPCGPDDVVSELHEPLGATESEYGMAVQDWLDHLGNRRRITLMFTLLDESQVVDKVDQAFHPSGAALIESVPDEFSPQTAVTPPLSAAPIIDRVLTVPKRDAATSLAVREVDSLIAAMKDRTLVPTAEFIDRLLDLRLALDADQANGAA